MLCLCSYNSIVDGYPEVLEYFRHALLCKMASCCVGSTKRDPSHLKTLVSFGLCLGSFRNGRISTLQALFTVICLPPGNAHLSGIPLYHLEVWTHSAVDYSKMVISLAPDVHSNKQHRCGGGIVVVLRAVEAVQATLPLGGGRIRRHRWSKK